MSGNRDALAGMHLRREEEEEEASAHSSSSRLLNRQKIAVTNLPNMAEHMSLSRVEEPAGSGSFLYLCFYYTSRLEGRLTITMGQERKTKSNTKNVKADIDLNIYNLTEIIRTRTDRYVLVKRIVVSVSLGTLVANFPYNVLI